MRFPSLLLLASFLLCAPHLSAANSVPLILDLRRTNDIEITRQDDGSCNIVTKGEDPYIFTKPFDQNFDPGRLHVLSCETFALKKIEGVQIFLSPPITQSHSVTDGVIQSSEAWVPFSMDLSQAGMWNKTKKVFRIDFGRRDGLRFQIRNLELREPTAEELQRAKTAEAKARLEESFGAGLRAYFKKDFANRVEEVIADKKEISVTLTATRPLTLIEVRPWQSVQQIKRKDQFLWSHEVTKGRQTIRIPRAEASGEFPYDRLYSKWCLMEVKGDQVELASHAVYCTDDSRTAVGTMPVPQPGSKKGLQISWRPNDMGQLDELGIEHAAVNLFSGALLRVNKDTPTVEHTFMGRTFKLNKNAVDQQSRVLKFAAERNMLVGGILLMDKNPPAPYEAMLHPDYLSSGIYSMANLTSEEGVFLYAMLVDFLSSYFSMEKNGFIHYWIVHNEVDAAWVWTNCGRRGPDTMMDNYVKSMRMVHHTARKYNPQAFTTISLTHYWNKVNSHGPGDTMYAPRHLLDILADHSNKEGDFNWGVAYHPYPCDLRNPEVWKDPVTWSFDTDIISYRNLEVLDAYMRQPRYLQQGRMRPIYLTEQGISNRNDSPQQLRIQAAAMAYAMKKVQAIDGIKGHILHRWVDHPAEGGLNLGLVQKKKKGAIYAAGEKKPSFDVYAAMGTPKEEAATRFALKVIELKSWNEIHHKGKIK